MLNISQKYTVANITYSYAVLQYIFENQRQRESKNYRNDVIVYNTTYVYNVNILNSIKLHLENIFK